MPSTTHSEFLAAFHKLREQGKKPSYEDLAAELNVSKSTVSLHMQRLRAESPQLLAPTCALPSPELVHAYQRDLQAGMASERARFAQDIVVREENERALAEESIARLTQLEEAWQRIKTTQEALTTALAQRDNERDNYRVLAEMLDQKSQKLAEARAELRAVEMLREKASRAEQCAAELASMKATLGHMQADLDAKRSTALRLSGALRESERALQEAKVEIARLTERLSVYERRNASVPE